MIVFSKPEPKTVHIISIRKKWALKKQDKSRATKIYKTQEEAISTIPKLKKEGFTKIVIHKTDGTVNYRINIE